MFHHLLACFNSTNIINWDSIPQIDKSKSNTGYFYIIHITQNKTFNNEWG